MKKCVYPFRKYSQVFGTQCANFYVFSFKCKHGTIVLFTAYSKLFVCAANDKMAATFSAFHISNYAECIRLRKNKCFYFVTNIAL